MIKVHKIWTPDFTKIFITAVLITLVSQIQATTFPLFVQSLDESLVIAGLISSVYMGVSALIKPFVGTLLRKKKKKTLCIFSGIVFACILSFYGHVKLILPILFLRIASAIFYSICSISYTTIATDLIPQDRMLEGIGYFNFTQTISTAFGSALALFVINNYGYKQIFLLCSVCVFVGVIIIVTIKYKDLAKEAPKKVQKDTKKISLKEKLTHIFSQALLPSCLTMFFTLIGTNGVVTYLPTWGKTKGIENIGLFFTFQAIASAISRLFIGKINKLIGSNASIVIGIICIEVSLLGIRFCSTLAELCILSLFLGFGSGLIVPTMHTIIVLLTPKQERGMANAIFQMVNDARVCVFSLTLGLLAEKVGIQEVFTYAAIFPAIGFAIYISKMRKQIINLGL